MRCPSLEKLTDFLRGLGAETERLRIQDHLATGCLSCEQNRQWLVEVKHLAVQDDSFDFPAALTAHIIAWMPAKSARTPLRTLVAQLLFDSFAPPSLAEARAAVGLDADSSTMAGRQLLYEVEDYNVDLRIEKIVDAYELLGQVLPEDPTSTELVGLSVQLRRDESSVVSTTTDTEGMFRFTDLMPNTYELCIVLGEDMIEIPELSVR